MHLCTIILLSFSSVTWWWPSGNGGAASFSLLLPGFDSAEEDRKLRLFAVDSYISLLQQEPDKLPQRFLQVISWVSLLSGNQMARTKKCLSSVWPSANTWCLLILAWGFCHLSPKSQKAASRFLVNLSKKHRKWLLVWFKLYIAAVSRKWGTKKNYGSFFSLKTCFHFPAGSAVSHCSSLTHLKSCSYFKNPG